MATWQFDLYLVPTCKLMARRAELPTRIGVDELQTADWWEGERLPDDYKAFLDAFMPRRSTWSPAMLGWGIEDGNRIDVVASKDAVEEVYSRVDARALDFAFLEYLVRFAEHINCVFVTEEGEVVSASTSDLVREVESSSAHRFVVDPGTFIQSLDENEELP